MGESCWQDLSRLFIEGFVSCYHWDVAACENSGGVWSLMRPPLGSTSLLFCSSAFSLMEFCEVFVSNRRPTYQHPRRRLGDANTHRLYSLKPATHICTPANLFSPLTFVIATVKSPVSCALKGQEALVLVSVRASWLAASSFDVFCAQR